MTSIRTDTDYDKNSTILGNNQRALSGLLTNIGSDYKFLYFKPDPYGYPTGYGACYAPGEYSATPPVPMVPINTVLNTNLKLHTNESCKLNAALLQTSKKWEEQDAIKKWPASQIKTGLNMINVTGYLGTNTKYFIGKTPASTGTFAPTSGFSQSNAGTNSYSVEWYGFFKPTVTGNWTFTISSTKNNFLWVGDVAVNDYTYSTAQLATGKSQEFTFNCNKGRLYPIRIQCGFVSQGDTFNFTVRDPTGNSVQPLTIFKTYYNSNGSVFEKQMMYYALTGSGSPGLYNCLVSSQNVSDAPIFKASPNTYKYATIWQLLSDGNQGLNQSNAFQFVPSDATVSTSTSTTTDTTADTTSNTGTLSIVTNGGTIVASIKDTATQREISFTAPVSLSLSDSGTLTAGTTTVFTPAVDDSVVNNNWYAATQTIPSTITDFSKLDVTNYPQNRMPAGTVILISPGGKYKLEMSATGNLVLKKSIAACSTASADSVKYTAASENSYYLYRVDADEKMDKMFMSNNSETTLAPISYDNPGIKLSTLTADDYNRYNGYFPDSTTGQVAKNLTNCKTACKQDPSCKYLYSYKSGNRDYCLTKSDGHLPKQFIPKQPTGNIQSSGVYVRNYDINLPATDPRRNIRNTVTNNYSAYADYELLIDKPFIVPDQNGIGYNGLSSELRDRLIINYNYVKGNGQPINQRPIMETFDNHGYVDGNKVRNKSGNPGDTDNLPNRISQQQIAPLKSIASDYNDLLGNIDGKYRDIKTNITGYKAARNSIAYDSTVEGDTTNDSRKKYDFETAGRTLLYNERKPTMGDAINEDLNLLIMQDNQLYFLGTITIAALLIGAVYFGKE